MRRTGWVLAAVLLLASAGPSHAQRTRCWRMRDGHVERCERDHDRDRRRHFRQEPVELGVRGGYDFDAEVGTFGGHLRVPVAGPVTFIPSFDVSVDDAGPPWQANADVVVRPDRLAGLYAGVGAGFVHLEDETEGDHDTEVGLNVLVGLDGGRIADTRLRPFAEGRWTRIDDDRDAFRLVAGFSVAISNR
jgi:opacity protein-like surface antigen